MAKQTRYAGNRGYRGRSRGMERALKHIEEGREFSREMGGTDEDVKAYFFQLNLSELSQILSEYGRLYGKSPETYAREAFPDWKTGKRQMSGLVAKRLFGLLPKSMPIDQKYSLVKSLWKFKCPRSQKRYYIGPDVAASQVGETISTYLLETVKNYDIPDEIVNRFRWLAEGDVELQQKLANHFMQLERVLITDGINHRLPMLLQQVVNNRSQTSIVQNLKIGNHLVDLHFAPHFIGICETAPPSKEDFKDKYGCLVLVAILIAVYMLLAAFG
jgi:hypothetical protein